MEEREEEQSKEKQKKRSFPTAIGGAEKRTEALSVAKGGRALTSQSSWENGAQDGEAYMLFSFVDASDKELPSRHFRCVLCARFHGKESIVKAENGQSNLWAHLSSTWP